MASAILPSHSPSTRTGRRPNVLILLTDDQGFGDLSCHGHPVVRTPAIDRIHSQSIRLNDFHVSPMCTPSRGQILTGVDCLRNGAMATSLGRHFLRTEFPTAADLFAGGGYRTGIFGKWHLGDTYPYRPMDRGFQEAIYHLGFGLSSADEHWNNDYFDPWYRHNGELKQAKGYCTDFWFDSAMAWMDCCRVKKEPFFCYLPTNVPHFPMWVQDEYREKFAAYGADPAGFFGMIEQLDQNVARLDAFLKKTGLMDDTIFIFMTDNGHAGGALNVYNAGMRGGKCSRYDGGHRVPCFIRWPGGGLRGAADLQTPAQAQDIVPTLLDLAGIPARDGVRFDGASLAPLLRGDNSHLAERMFVVQYFQNSVAKDDAAVIWKQWRLVFGKELYDIHADPGQKNDVAAANPEVVRAMKEFYDRWWSGVEGRLNDFSPVHIGSDAEPEVMISCCEWADDRCDGAGAVREAKGSPAGGPWHVMVEKEGAYRVELRRWPRESGLALDSGAPEFRARAGILAAGKALPIRKAEFIAGGKVQTAETPSGTQSVSFEVRLKKGRTLLHGKFLDSSGANVCGAYYAYVSMIGRRH